MNQNKDKWVEAKPTSKLSKIIMAILGFLGVIALIIGLTAK
jgi:hypothetical protein